MSGGSLLKKGLPYDAEIEYLETPNVRGPYIVTNVSLSNHLISARIQQLQYVNDCALFGAWRPNYASIFHITYYTVRYYFGCSEAVEQNVFIPNDFNTEWHNYELSPESFKLDGNTLAQRAGQFIETKLPCAIFGRYINNSVQITTSSASTRISYFTIFDLDTNKKVFDAIPVRIGQVGYMYDKVSGQLFGNAGTGDFILGNDI